MWAVKGVETHSEVIREIRTKQCWPGGSSGRFELKRLGSLLVGQSRETWALKVAKILIPTLPLSA